MSEDWGITIFALLVIAFAVFLTAVVITEKVQQTEREFSCIGLGYEGYNEDLDACYSGENPMVSRPYETVFDK